MMAKLRAELQPYYHGKPKGLGCSRLAGSAMEATVYTQKTQVEVWLREDGSGYIAVYDPETYDTIKDEDGEELSIAIPAEKGRAE